MNPGRHIHERRRQMRDEREEEPKEKPMDGQVSGGAFPEQGKNQSGRDENEKMRQDGGRRDGAPRIVGQHAWQVRHRVERAIADHDPGRLVRHRVERIAVSQSESWREPDRGPGEVQIATDGNPERKRENRDAEPREDIGYRSRRSAAVRRLFFLMDLVFFHRNEEDFVTQPGCCGKRWFLTRSGGRFSDLPIPLRAS